MKYFLLNFSIGSFLYYVISNFKINQAKLNSIIMICVISICKNTVNYWISNPINDGIRWHILVKFIGMK